MDPLALADLRRTLTRASLATSKRMRRAEKEGTVLGEETLTEMMVLEILENLRHCREPFNIETYNHHQESQNGADLRIWLNLDDAVIGFSIQAKKAKLDAQQRVVASSLDHLVGRAKKRQVDILIARSVRDRTNPIHLIYQSPSLGFRLGMNGGCFAMSSYRMDGLMHGITQSAKRVDLQRYRHLLFPWSTLVNPQSPGRRIVPLHVVLRSPRTQADMIDMFGFLGNSLGSGSYGAGKGAYRYGLIAPTPPSAEEPGDGPDGGGGDSGPDTGGSAERDAVSNGEKQSSRDEQGGSGGQREPEAKVRTYPDRQSRQDGTESVLFRSAPKRVIHLGEPMEVGDFGTPLCILEQRERGECLELPSYRNDGNVF